LSKKEAVEKPLRRARPLSPHLTIYRPQMSSMLSITHRMTGVILFFSVMLLIWTFVFSVYNADDLDIMSDFFKNNFVKFILLGLTFCLFYHLSNGIRHLLWDVGYGYDIKTMEQTGWMVIISAVTLTALTWFVAY
jgi:succinate dehydrogenase / fumarate reductase cytochrome b subunit